MLVKIDPKVLAISLNQILAFEYDELLQVFSCEFCYIFKNTFFYRTPLVAASNSLESLTGLAALVCWATTIQTLAKYIRQKNLHFPPFHENLDT